MRVLLLVLILVKLCTPVWAGGTPSPASQAYAPVRGTCPDNFSLVRKAGDTPSTQTLSADEAKYISVRRSDVLPAAWSAYLANVQAAGDRLPTYVSDILKGNATNAPTLGIAKSGGGLRAAMVGAGVLSALDGRNTTAQHVGTGGLLQAATYLTALSGGSWLVTSLAQANFPEIQDLVFASGSGGNTFGGWDTDLNVLAPNNISAPYWSVLIEEMSGKFAAGFPVTFIDMWSRAVARHFVNGTTRADLLGNTTLHGAGVTFSSISELPTFKSHTQPFPIVLFTSNSVHGNSSNEFNGDTLVPVNNPIYEVNVYEMGSYDPLLSAFTPTKYLGTQNSSVCVTGFDQASFMEATSSAFFTVLNTTEALANPNTLLGAIVPILNQTFPQTGIPLDYPNPFKGVAPDMFLDDNEEYLSLVDGGNDAENIPFMPLLVKTRGVDVILAIDVTAGSADDSNNNFCNGRSLIATHNRTTFFPSYYSFPTVPLNTSTILAEGLTTRPVFFGCEANADEPLVIYIANGAPPPGQPAITNFSSFDFDFTSDQAQAIMGQGFTFATQGISNGTVVRDEDWPACLACAVTDRARDRSGAAREGVCASCFERYCWGAQGAVAGKVTANSGPAGRSLTLTMTVVLLVLSTIWLFI